MIYWLEDRIGTIKDSVDGFDIAGIPFEIHATPSSLHYTLLDIDANDQVRKPSLFLIDLMLADTLNLDALGIPNAPTNGGTYAGFVFLDRYFYSDKNPFKNVPAALVTSHEISKDLKDDIQTIEQRTGTTIKLFNKDEDEERKELLQYAMGLVK